MAARSLSYPREARLLTPGAFKRVFAGAERVADRYFTVLASSNGGDHARLGLAIGRRVSPRAVDRNRIKRIARESFRHHQHQLPPVDIVLMARPSARHGSRETLYASLAGLWQRVMKRCERSSPQS